MQPSLPSTSEKYLSIGAAAKELGVSIDTLRRWDASGKIQVLRTAGGTRRIAATEIHRVQNKEPLSQPTISQEQYLSVGPAAKALGVSVDTLRRWDASGKIKFIRTAGGSRKISLTEIERLKNNSPQPQEKIVTKEVIIVEKITSPAPYPSLTLTLLPSLIKTPEKPTLAAGKNVPLEPEPSTHAQEPILYQTISNPLKGLRWHWLADKLYNTAMLSTLFAFLVLLIIVALSYQNYLEKSKSPKPLADLGALRLSRETGVVLGTSNTPYLNINVETDINELLHAKKGISFENSGFSSVLNSATLTGNQNISLPDQSGTLCLTTGNCAKSGGGVVVAPPPLQRTRPNLLPEPSTN